MNRFYAIKSGVLYYNDEYGTWEEIPRLYIEEDVTEILEDAMQSPRLNVHVVSFLMEVTDDPDQRSSSQSS